MQSSHLTFPARLYGRERHQQQLLQAFRDAADGQGLFVPLCGRSGAGKTALARSLVDSVTQQNGFFLEGKFNQYQQGIPLFAFRHALGQLAADLLKTEPGSRSRIRTEILDAVGNLGGLITGLVPKLETLLGPQPAVSAISPMEAPHRFSAVIRRFLSVLCKPEHPLVLFIDDWQWADSSSLRLLDQLRLNTELRYILVIASYRDDEVDKAHPLSAALEELDLQAVPRQKIAVGRLDPGDVKSILADTLVPAVANADRLAERVYTTTQGNPFYLRSLLESLCHSQALHLDSTGMCWRWDEQNPFLSSEAGDVAHLFAQRILGLPSGCRERLSVAACLGHQFKLDLLAIVFAETAEACVQELAPAFAEDLVVTVDAECRTYRFRHDRVQQAAHSLIQPARLPKLRLNIGRLLEQQLDDAQRGNQLLEITAHYNAGRELVSEPSDIRRLIALNVESGIKSHGSTAYASALGFFRIAGQLLEKLPSSQEYWKLDHDRTMRWFKAWSECEFLEGEVDQAEHIIRTAVQNALSPLEQADALCQLIMQFTLQARYGDAIAAGRQGLSAVGVTLPEGEYERTRDDEIEQVYAYLRAHGPEGLSCAEPMRDPRILMIIRVLITMGPPCYRSHQRLWSVIVPKVVNLTLRHGPVPQIGYSHTAFGGLLAWVNQDFDTARIFADLATRLMTNVFVNPVDQSVFHLMFGSSTRHWFDHLSRSSSDYGDAWSAGLDSGNLQYAAYAFGHNMYCRFFQGTPLPDLMEETEKSLAFSHSRKNQWAVDLLQGGLGIFRHLAGEQALTASWRERFEEAVDRHRNLQVRCIFNIMQSTLHLFLHQWDQALACSNAARDLIHTVGTQGLLPWPEFVFKRFLILARINPGLDDPSRQRNRQELEALLGQLETWSLNAPVNYRFKLSLAKAELLVTEQRFQEALVAFQDAAEEARRGRFVQWEAYASERAFCAATETGQTFLAQIHWQGAYIAFVRWGAQAKIRLLEEELARDQPSGTSGPPVVADRVRDHLTRLREQASAASEEEKLVDTSLLEDLTRATDRLRQEVVQRRRAEQDLRLAASVFKHAREGIVITDDEVTIIDVNQSFSQSTGHSRAEAVGRKPDFLKSDRHDDSFYEGLWKDLKLNGHWHGEIWLGRKDGEAFAALLTISTVKDPQTGVQHFVGLFSDISDLMRQHNQLEYTAYHDSLTGLPNRMLFADRLRHAMALAKRNDRRIMVMFLDLDGFKAINDAYGHDVGDRVLIHVTDQMKKVLRDSDTLARLGGDEFVVVATEIDTDRSEGLFSRLLAVTSEPILIEGQAVQVSASLGVTEYPQSEDIDAEQLVRQADQAMYQAKIAGKNRFFRFDQSHDRQVRTQHQILSRIRDGIAADEFLLVYQPKVHMSTGRVIGVEALVRWQHPERGLLSPEHFLPLINDTDLQVDLGEKVLEKALRQLEAWQAIPLNLPVSVNIAADHLQDPDFGARLRRLLARHTKVSPSLLELEVLETSAIEDIEHSRAVIRECQAMGVRFSMDDFGTGYASLTYLKQLPVETLKLDKSFIRDLLDDADALSILQGVVGLAAAFGRQLVAEGVESVEQGERLLSLGCEYGQGFGIARPMAADALPAWVDSWKPYPSWQKWRPRE